MGSFTFIDLFSGIGGFHLACAKNKGKCIAACEIDPVARTIYELNFVVKPHDDIKTLKKIANIDLICAGFPCQPYSSLGEQEGLDDERGKLFLYLTNFIQTSKPKCFLLENVVGLITSDGGKNFTKILQILNNIGYNVTYAILDSKNFDLPQHRERVYIVGHTDYEFDFSTLLAYKKNKIIKYILDTVDAIKRKIEPENLNCEIFKKKDIFTTPVKTDVGFLLRGKRSNFTNRKLFSTNGIIGTIATASPPPIYDERLRTPRHLSISELKKCQGFPVSYKFPKNTSRSSIVHYIGNAVSVNVVAHIIEQMKKQGFLGQV